MRLAQVRIITISASPAARRLTICHKFASRRLHAISFGDNNVTKLTISGAGGTLLVTNGGVTVSADAPNGPTNNALLDLSGLDNFSMNGTQIRIGVEGSGSFHHASGVIYLAQDKYVDVDARRLR